MMMAFTTYSAHRRFSRLGNHLADHCPSRSADASADDSTSAASHLLTDGCPCRSACCATYDGSGLTFTVGCHGTAYATAHGATNNTASLAAHGLADGCSSRRPQPTTHCSLGIRVFSLRLRANQEKQ